MELKMLDNFGYELEQAKQRLLDMGRDVEIGDSIGSDSGLTCDFELPYSSLPKIQVQRWK